MMEIRVGSGPHGHRWAWTEGLSVHGQADFALPMPWEDGNWRDEQAKKVLRFLASYVEAQPKRIHAGETMRYGWTLLAFREGTRDEGEVSSSRLVVGEVADPLRGVEPTYVDGAQRAIILQMHQGYAAYRLGIQEMDHPHRSMSAIVCTRLPRSGATTFFMSRTDPVEGHESSDSGWFVGCSDTTHDHDDPDELANVHLLHLVENYPAIFTYLALPADTMIAFEDGRRLVFKPKSQEPVIDTDKPFTGLDIGPTH